MESMSYREKADRILEDLLEIKPEIGVTAASMLMLFYEKLDEAGFFLDPEWEYGYRSISYDGRDLGVSNTSRTPASWITSMGRPYRRQKQIDPGAWEFAPDAVVIELDRRPWLKPGADPDSHPLENRTEEREVAGSEFKPRNGYEQDIEKYGFRYAKCGRTDQHWAHSTAEIIYCNGFPR